MIKDPIVEEVRAIRDRFAKTHGYDVHRIFEAIRKMEKSSGRTYVSVSTRRSTVRAKKRSPKKTAA